MTPMTKPFTAEEIIKAIGIKLAEERAHRIALEARQAELEARQAELIAQYENIALTPGPQGASGEKGLDGVPGEIGPPGEPGSPGKLPLVRAWADGVHYEGDVVTRDGATWQAQRDTGRPPPHDDWICLAGAGRDGVDGNSFRVCGTWQGGLDYKALDVVVLNGGAFVAKRDDPGPCPGDGWQLMASQGKQGKPGEKGARGDKGDPGTEIVDMTIDSNGLLTLIRGDGSTITCREVDR